MAARLATAMRKPLASRRKLLGVGDAAVKQASITNLAVLETPTLPAIERYTGVLFDALDYGGLPARTRRRIDAQVFMFSGLWGVVAATDPIPDYKTKMGASLAVLGKLSTWWRPQITHALAPLAQRRVVWDLLPNEHAAAWTPTDIDLAGRITVTFLDDVGSGEDRRLVAVNHWNKLLKGALVRHVVEHQLTDPAGLVEFDHPEGYRYSPDRTVVDGNHTAIVLVSRRTQ